jgi:hypothetical protein
LYQLIDTHTLFFINYNIMDFEAENKIKTLYTRQ